MEILSSHHAMVDGHRFAYATGADTAAATVAAAQAARRIRLASATLLNEAVADDVAGRSAAPTPGAALTGREREVVALLADGLSAKEAAVRLNISSKTVETHRAKAMFRLGVCSVAELTKYAVLQGLSPLDTRRSDAAAAQAS